MSDQTVTLVDLRARFTQYRKDQKWETLLEEARAARVVYPESWELVFFEALAMMESADYADAEKLLLDGMATLGAAGAPLSVLYGKVGNRLLSRPGAIARWQDLLERFPDIRGVYIGLAQAYRAAGQISAGDRAINAGLQRLPDDLQLLVVQAEWDTLRRDWTAALQHWTALAERVPERPGIQEAIETARSNLERLRAAAPAEGASATGPDADIQATLAHAAAMQQQGQVDEAERTLLEAIEQHSDNEALLLASASLASDTKRWSDALARWKTVYERCPPSLAMYLGYISVLEELGKYLDADEIASEALGFEPDHIPLNITFANLAFKRFDFEEGTRRWRDLARQHADDPTVAEGAEQAKETVKLEKKNLKRDTYVPKGMATRGSLVLPKREKGAEIMPQSGPSALDLLVTGAPAGDKAIIRPVPSTGWRSLLQRLFG